MSTRRAEKEDEERGKRMKRSRRRNLEGKMEEKIMKKDRSRK